MLSKQGMARSWLPPECVCICAHVFNVSVVLVNSINVIFLAPLFMSLAEGIRQIK